MRSLQEPEATKLTKTEFLEGPHFLTCTHNMGVNFEMTRVEKEMMIVLGHVRMIVGWRKMYKI